MSLSDAEKNVDWVGDPRQNMLFAHADQEVIGYGQISRWEEESVVVLLYLWYLVPKWRGCGIEESLLQWSEGRMRDIAAEAHRGRTCMAAANASETERDAAEFLLGNGFIKVKTLVDMLCDDLAAVPAIDLSAPYEIRALQQHQRRLRFLARSEAFHGPNHLL